MNNNNNNNNNNVNEIWNELKIAYNNNLIKEKVQIIINKEIDITIINKLYKYIYI